MQLGRLPSRRFSFSPPSTDPGEPLRSPPGPDWVGVLLLAGLLALACFLLSGCGAPGRAQAPSVAVDASAAAEPSSVVLTRADGTRLEATLAPGTVLEADGGFVQQPAPAKDAASLRIWDLWLADTGAAAQVLAFFSSNWIFILGGMALAVGGVVVFAAKRSGAPWAAPIPRHTGKSLAVLGGILMVLPWFLEAYGWVILVVVLLVITALVAKYALNWADDRDLEGLGLGRPGDDPRLRED